MNQKNKNIVTIVIIALLILTGIVVVSVWGFNKELRLSHSQSIEIYTDTLVDRKKVKSIADEVLGMHNMVQTVEIYEDTVIIRANTISEEQKNNIVNKMKENYQFEQTAENTKIKTIPTTRIRDMYKQYILPLIISGFLVVIYMGIRYYKNGILKVVTKSILIPVVAELILLSWMAIVRIPIGIYTPVLVLLIYIISVIYLARMNEK